MRMGGNIIQDSTEIKIRKKYINDSCHMMNIFFCKKYVNYFDINLLILLSLQSFKSFIPKYFKIIIYLLFILYLNFYLYIFIIYLYLFVYIIYKICVISLLLFYFLQNCFFLLRMILFYLNLNIN